ncbi:DUF2125 domain-containing protein [Tritonibacter horizontis]|uniref:DUF2125 domain-containing protein n=1 Tax=Tritonibacter horizontis TaxID=1768241 RepID=A0A132BSM8_9RHOB|nr:DUF2125 domain-containing protein [Tritonibacter horizontis]KUP91216.1 hypothetical protein TRIHO_39030 [Tritonibacter horizontis]
MKRGLKILVTLALAWSLYWVVAGWGLRQSVRGWFDTQAELGWQVDVGAIAMAPPRGGFPLRHRTRIDRPALADPQSGAAWRADWLELESPAVWPGRQILRFADGAQRLSYYDRTAVIETETLQAQMGLAPGIALEVEDLTLTSGRWRIGNGQVVTLSAADLALQMAQQDAPETYRITAEATAFRPGAELRRLFRAAPELPQTFDALSLAATVRFDAPWTRDALEQRRPQPRHITLDLAEAHWGDMRLKSAGSLEIDGEGIPTGSLAVQIEDWEAVLDMAADSGLLSASGRTQAGRILGLLARASGRPENLDITLGFRGGYITFGPIPLGPAPRLILH